MLTAYSGMPSREFIAQLRTFVIAFSCGPAVVDCVDNLTGADEDEQKHCDEIIEAENEAETRGRQSMKDEIIDVVVRVLDSNIADSVLALMRDIEA